MRRAISVLFASVVFALIVVAGATALQPTQTGQFGSSGSAAGQLSKPGGVAVDQTSGDLFVADTENNRIDVFDTEGTFLRAWGWGVEDGSEELQVCTTTCQAGLAGPEEGEMDEVIGVAVNPTDGNVYTLNRGNGRIQVFEPSGALLPIAFGGYEEHNQEKFDFPLAYGNDIAIDSTGNVYVSDGYNVPARIAVFDSTGSFQRSITDEAGPGKLINASSLAVDSAGNLYVDDPFADHVVVFGPTGAYLRKEAPNLETHGLAIDPKNDHLFAEASEAENDYTLYEYGTDGKLVEETPVPGLADSTESFVSFGLADSGVAAFPGREAGALYATDLNANRTLILTSAKAGAPIVEAVRTESVGSGGADLAGSVNPNSAETSYYFEYGPTAAYGSKSPPFGFDIGGRAESIGVGTHLAGLQASTTYHYRLVAVNALGTTPSADQTFTTLAPGGAPETLPDGRAYELVSPVDKNLNDIADSVGLSSSDGDAVAFSTLNGLPGAENGGLFGAYVARRGSTGWTTVPASPADTNNAGLLTSVPLIYSRDLGRDVVKSTDNLTGNAASDESGNLFLRTDSPLSYQLLTPRAEKGEGVATFWAVGASADFSRIYFQANASLISDAPPSQGVYPQIYEWHNGTLRLAGISPEGIPITEGAEAVANYTIPRTGVVSEDGSRLFFSSPTATAALSQLYMRVNGEETVEISKSVRSEPDPHQPPTAATFQGASADGSSAFFTSNVELTDDADTGHLKYEPGGEPVEYPTDYGANLYRYENGTLTDLTVDLEQNTERGADVRGVLIAAGGRAAYFGATGVLAPGATAEAPNLYRWTQGGGVEFVTTISEKDPFMDPDEVKENLQVKARTTADGNVLIFSSIAPIGGRVETNAKGEAAPEIYRYAAGAGIACVSCSGRGTAVEGAVVNSPQFVGGGGNALSADGSRVFFQTADPLVPGDVNGTVDVYEWEAGQVHLISGGTGSSPSFLLDPSPSGNDVFFTTRDRLVGSDSDENVDVYDARVGGGFPESTETPPCGGEGCRPPSGASPPAPSLGSKGFDGPGNLKPKHRRKKHHKKKHHAAKQCKAKGKKKCPAHRDRHSTGKRG